MGTHNHWQRELTSFLVGELDDGRVEALRTHARTCEECAGVIDTASTLSGIDPEPLSLRDSVAIRSVVIRELRQDAHRRQEDPPPGTASAPAFGALELHRWVAFAAAVALAAVGFLGGLAWPRADTSALVAGIERAALNNRTLNDVENSAYVLSNVSLRTLDGRRMAASFDVTSHVSVTAERSSPLVHELVVQAVLNPGNVGPRLKAIGYAEDLQGSEVKDTRVKDALRIAMINDQNLAVRLRALSALAGYPGDPGVQSAFLTVLETSDSVQMRLLAIDYLVENRVDPAAIREALQHLDPTAHAAAFAKARAYLQ